MPEAPHYPASHHLLDGKTVLITAAAGAGIGFATARRCAEEGARVVISDKHEQRLDEVAAQIAELSENYPIAVPCDVTNEDDVQRMFERAEQELGQPIDCLVNNAGLGLTKQLVEMTDEEWSAVLDVTLTGTMRCTREALRRMIPRDAGCIVNNASIIGWRAQEGQAAYAAAKAGVMALTRTAAMEGAPHGIRVNAVSPSLAIHPFLSKVMPEETLQELIQLEAFQRSAETWEVANVIVFLASDYSSYMTGEVVSVSSQHP
jgi:3-oxoacyl-[acyl-carrier protein] reductase